LPLTIKKAKRINDLPPYLFAEIDRRKREALSRGVDLIDLGIGDPDIPTPSMVVEKLLEGASRPANHRYPSSSGMPEFRQAVSNWYKSRFGVSLDPGKEVCSLIGSKEGIGNMAVAFVDPGDIVLVSSPCYPVYHIGTAFNGGTNYFLPLKKENHFLPDLDAIPADIAKQAKLLWINYPNNPTAAIVDCQSVKTSESGGPRGYDAGKKINGRKRHVLVDTLGLLLRALVHPANVQDRDGLAPLLSRIRRRFPWLRLLFADGGYQGQVAASAAREERLELTIVKRSDDAAGFVVLPRRWVVERTFAWFGRNRRLAKDVETLIASSTAIAVSEAARSE
jgi:transposase